LKARQPALDKEAAHAANMVAVAADAIIRAEAERVLAVAEEARAAWLGHRRLLAFMQSPECLAYTPPGWAFPHLNDDDAARRERNSAFAELDKRIERFLRLGAVDEPGWAHHPDVQPWAEARVALLTDPDAALPPG
jgi:hypothetical protein